MARKSFFKFPLKKMAAAASRLFVANSFRLVLLCAFGTAAFFIERSIYADPSFRLRYFDIQTSGSLNHKKIVTWSELKAGGNIFDIDLKSVEQKLLRHPEIKMAHLRRIMPNRIGIFVSERLPYVQVLSKPNDREFWTLDEEGFAIPSLWTKISKRLPVLIVEDLAQYPLRVGELWTNPRFSEIKDLIAAISQSGVLSWDDITSIMSKSSGDYEIWLRSGMAVYIRADFSEGLNKLSHFRDLMNPVDPSVEYIDVRFHDVAVKRKKESSATNPKAARV